MHCTDSIPADFFIALKKHHSCSFGLIDCATIQGDPAFFADSLGHEERYAFLSIRNQQRQQCRTAGRLAAYKALQHFHGCKQKRWTILNNTNGTPYLPDASSVYLSITHTQQYAIAAVAGSPIGIDLELIESRPTAFINRFFSEAEQMWIRSPGIDETEYERLHIAWTRKEAISKLLGAGGHIGFRSLPVLEDTSPYSLESLVIGDHVFSIALNDLTETTP